MSTKNKSKDNIENLQEKLQGIKDREGIIGYILRGSNSASIDLKDPTKIIDYAVLSNTAFKAGQDMSAMFEVGEVESIIMEGENTKILSRVVNEHRLSISWRKTLITTDCART